ncbi:MAG: hypothetical protein Ct9H90mP23_3010 [Methanobacteriota archaeon]|nr:MAG: hypothetical protein Ct9H90mP23_3010 [Euryarchaeota archaeon]
MPVYPDSDRDCDTNIDPSSGHDECRMMLWLNATMTILASIIPVTSL